jgi:hypothetical protein
MIFAHHDDFLFGDKNLAMLAADSDSVVLLALKNVPVVIEGPKGWGRADWVAVLQRETIIGKTVATNMMDSDT